MAAGSGPVRCRGDLRFKASSDGPGASRRGCRSTCPSCPRRRGPGLRAGASFDPRRGPTHSSAGVPTGFSRSEAGSYSKKVGAPPQPHRRSLDQRSKAPCHWVTSRPARPAQSSVSVAADGKVRAGRPHSSPHGLGEDGGVTRTAECDDPPILQQDRGPISVEKTWATRSTWVEPASSRCPWMGGSAGRLSGRWGCTPRSARFRPAAGSRSLLSCCPLGAGTEPGVSYGVIDDGARAVDVPRRIRPSSRTAHGASPMLLQPGGGEWLSRCFDGVVDLADVGLGGRCILAPGDQHVPVRPRTADA